MEVKERSPNSEWRPGDKIEAPVGNWKTFEADKISQREMYRFIIGAIVPRPIAFVSTISKEGVGNLAPYSFFNGVSSNPPCLIISISRKGDSSGDKKDTLRNIEETGEFVVNSANEWLIEPLVHCAGAFPYGVDEMQKAGLTPLASQFVRPARVKESAIQLECKLHQLVEIGDGSAGSTTLVIGRIVAVHMLEQAFKENRPDYQFLKPVGRLGGLSYATLGEVFQIAVPES
jgi:flavin reductase (DIM6/NTAB) family NADH-FMN oxidoreductase RutF